MEWVQQKNPYGCGLASLAMICGQSYDQVRDWFLARGRDIEANHGGTWWDWDAYLVEHGYFVARKFTHLLNQPRDLWPPEPFGDVYLCEVRTTSGNAHVVVARSDGTVLDPARPGLWSFSDYPQVDSIAGVLNGLHLLKARADRHVR